MSVRARQAPTPTTDGWRARAPTQRTAFSDTRRAVFSGARRAAFYEWFGAALPVAYHSGRSSGAWAVDKATPRPIAHISDAEAVPRSRMSGGRSCGWHGHLTPPCASAIWKRCG